MNARLIRVGVDTGKEKGDGFLAPFFEDGNFEYIPISEDYPSHQPQKYKDLKFKKYVPKELWKKKPHFDPEFKTYTYGDPSDSKALDGITDDQIEKGAYLIFWENFFPYQGEYKNYDLAAIKRIQRKKYKVVAVIGYFKIKKVIDLSESDITHARTVKKKYKNNAHLLRVGIDWTRLVVGDRNKSKKLKKGYPIAWEYKKEKGGYVGSKELERYGLHNKPFMQSYITYPINGKQKVQSFLKKVEKGPSKTTLKKIFS